MWYGIIVISQSIVCSVCVTTQHASQFILIVSVTYICQILSYGLYYALGRCAAIALLLRSCGCPVAGFWFLFLALDGASAAVDVTATSLVPAMKNCLL